MTSQLVSTYTLTLTTSIPSTLVDRMEDAPLDYSLLSLQGLGLTSDSTSSTSSAITRTITLFSVPGTPAVLTPVLEPGDPTGSPIASVTVNTQGGSYAVPPVLTLANPAGAPAPTVPAILVVQLGIVSVTVVDGGAGYATTPTVTASGGGLASGGTQATFTVTLSGESINTVVPATAGGPYTDLNSLALTVTGGGGSGAVLVPVLGIVGVQVVNAGKGYVPNCTCTVTPYFKSLYPDSIGAVAQASSIDGWMVNVLQAATNASITQATVAD